MLGVDSTYVQRFILSEQSKSAWVLQGIRLVNVLYNIVREDPYCQVCKTAMPYLHPNIRLYDIFNE
jgi:hypothetical protein